MKKVMVFGTFDLLHKGHEYFLKTARALGDYLVVVVGRDNNVEKFKASRPVDDENKRLSTVSSLEFVDEAILGRTDHDIDKILKERKPDIICLGYDQESFGIEKKMKIVRLKPYNETEFKSSILRKKNGF